MAKCWKVSDIGLNCHRLYCSKYTRDFRCRHEMQAEVALRRFSAGAGDVIRLGVSLFSKLGEVHKSKRTSSNAHEICKGG